MNANVRRLLAVILIFAGLSLLNTYSDMAALWVFGLVLILLTLQRIKVLGFQPRYIATMLLSVFFLICAFYINTPGPTGLLWCLAAFNLAMVFALYLYFRPRLKTEGPHRGAKIIIALTLTFVLLVDLAAAYILIQQMI